MSLLSTDENLFLKPSTFSFFKVKEILESLLLLGLDFKTYFIIGTWIILLKEEMIFGKIKVSYDIGSMKSQNFYKFSSDVDNP